MYCLPYSATGYSESCADDEPHYIAIGSGAGAVALVFTISSSVVVVVIFLICHKRRQRSALSADIEMRY